MQKLIAILTAAALTFAVSVQAKEHEDQDAAKAQSQKPKNAQKQQIAPKQQQQQLKAPKTTHVEKVQTPKTAHVEKVQTPKTTHVEKVQTSKTTHVEKVQTPKTVSPKVTKEKIETAKPQQEQLQTTTPQLQKTKLSKETVSKIQSQHLNFQAKPSTSIASVQFNPDYRIAAAQNWSGAQYDIFRSYQPQWHDQTWYRSRYSNNLSLIGGGWYFWEAGYWYPAWGYDDAAAYYPYDGPIYSGPSVRPFDRVVADVQAVLQEQGYYKGEVDGLLGPLTRRALAEYQSSEGLYATETIDQPTLESLGLAG